MDVRLKLDNGTQMPFYATEGASGIDLAANETVVIKPGETKVIRTGLSFEIPRGIELQIRPRSGISSKTKLEMILGTVDSDYRGEIKIIVKNRNLPTPEVVPSLQSINNTYQPSDTLYPVGTYIIETGDRIAQGIFAPVVIANFIVTDDLEQTSRGENGFGHSGVKSNEALGSIQSLKELREIITEVMN